MTHPKNDRELQCFSENGESVSLLLAPKDKEKSKNAINAMEPHGFSRLSDSPIAAFPVHVTRINPPYKSFPFHPQSRPKMQRKRHPRATTAQAMPRPYRTDPAMSESDIQTSVLVETLMSRLGRSSSVPILHRRPTGSKFDIVIRRTADCDAVNVARLVVSAPGYGLSLFREVITEETWTLTVQSIDTGDDARDRFDAFKERAKLHGLTIDGEQPTPAS